MPRIPAIFLAVVLLAIAAPAAGAVPTLNGSFDLPDVPGHLALGPDGNIWVILTGGTNDFAKVTPGGTVTPYDSSGISNAVGITAGPDGNMWVTQPNEVAKFSPSNPAVGTPFAITGLTDPRGITKGPDGNLWAASGGNVFKIPPANPTLDTPYPVSGMSARGIESGTDGRLWVADFSGRIVSVSTSGTPTFFNVGGGPQEVAGGPAGQIVFTNPGAIPESIGRLQQGGTPQVTDTPSADPSGATFGPDGAYWIGQFGGNSVARLTTDGQYTTLAGVPVGSGPRFTATGTGNTVWVTFETSKKVARISGVNPPPTPDTTKPVITGLTLSNKKFSVGKTATPVTVSKVAVGTKIGFTLSEAATTRIAIQRLLPGKRSGKKCVKPRRGLKHAKKCLRAVTKGTLQRLGIPGVNSVAFSGRIGKKPLAVGSYKFVLTATDAAGNVSASQSKSFKIVPKSHK